MDFDAARDSATTNFVGVALGTTVQAGTVHGGIHVHSPGEPVVPRQLRAGPVYFVDRRAELAELDRIADGAQGGPALAVISGPGGVGKSALALEWLRRTVARYPDGQLYVDLGAEGRSGPGLLAAVLLRFLRAFGVRGERVAGIGEAAALFRTVTAGKRVAILVENAASADQVRALLPAAAAAVVIVTARRRLGGLAMDGARFIGLRPLEAQASAELLVNTVGAARVRREPDAAERLIGFCGGLPVALSIAGARLATRPGWPVARMVRDLADERRRLSALAVEPDTSVRGVFELSYADLPAPVARAYRWLGLHSGPHFGVGVAGAALRGSVAETTDQVERLVDASLLEVAGTDRYRFHDLLRLHARQCAERDDTDEERAGVVRRMIAYYLDAAVAADRAVLPLDWRLGPAYRKTRGDMSAPDGALALDDIEAELPNLMAALRAGVDLGFDDLVWQLCEAMWSLFLYRKHFPDWTAAHELAAAAAGRCGNQAAVSRMRHRLGMGYHNLQRPDDAIRHGTAALAAARAAGHELAESEALQLIGMASRERGQLDEAIAVLRQAVDLDQRAGRLRAEALGRRRLGQTLTAAGRTAEAVTELELARTQAAEVGDAHVEANTMVWLAEALTRAGRAADAIGVISAAWATLDESGSAQYRAQVRMVWGEAAERLGDLTAAREHLTEALDLYARIGAPHVARVRSGLERVNARLAGPP